MAREESKQSREAEPLAGNESVAAAEEIVTPIEAGAQAQAEREFQTQRKISPSCKKAIVSVNGEDVNEVPIGRQDQAA